MNMIRFANCLWLAGIILAAGCGAPKPAPDPLAGWKVDYKHEPDQAVEKDYRDYIEKLPPEERMASSVSQYYEDGTGQHAIVVEVALSGTWWKHILFYDKNGERLKVVKYSPGRYRS